MIARVVVKQKIGSDRIFDYQVNNPKIDLYSIVEINFSGKKTLGAVIDFKKNTTLQCKSILNIISNGSFFTSDQINLARAISNYFISPFGPTLMSFMPQLPKKEIAKVGSYTKKTSNKISRSELILSGYEQRVLYYIQKLSRNGQNLIILPSASQIQNTIKTVNTTRPELQCYSWHSNLSSKEKRIIWQKCLSNARLTIIGTRDSLFLPYRKLTNIFIDNPTSFSYFEDQLPRYNAFFVSRLLRDQFHSNYFVGESFPSIISYVAYKNNNLKLKKINTQQIKAIIYDNFFEETNNISVRAKITNLLKKSKKILVVGGFNTTNKFFCRDCRYKIAPSGTQPSIDELFCPNCNGTNVVSLGHSKSDIVGKLKDLNSNNFYFYEIDQLPDISPIYDYAIFPFFDEKFDFPFITYKEKIINSLSIISEKVSGELLIFTNKYKDIIRLISHNDWEPFIKKQLIERKREGLPPYKKAIKIVVKKNKIKAKPIINKICQDIKSDNLFYLPAKKNGWTEAIIFISHNKFNAIKSLLKEKLSADLYFIVDPADFGL